MDSLTKRTIKFLAVCTDTYIVKTVLQYASKKVIKSICNAAINAARGDVSISDKLKRYFQSYRKVFKVLIDRKIGYQYKSNFILHNRLGSHKLIPPLLSCVLASIGNTFIVSDGNVQKVCTHQSKRTRSIEGKEDSGVRSGDECTSTY